MKRLESKAIDIKDLSRDTKNRMFELMRSYFNNVDPEIFEKDLLEKQVIILLTDKKTGQIQGFSSIAFFEQIIDGKPITLVYSGDTIIDKSCWGQTVLFKEWLNVVYSKKSGELYWYLICKGYRTYRFLPLYFKEFYPRHDKKTPVFEKNILDSFGKYKFGKHYDKAKGLVRFDPPRDFLKAGVSDIDARRLADPNVKFFLQNNPGHSIGNELACITKISKMNIKSIGHKLFLQNRKKSTCEI